MSKVFVYGTLMQGERASGMLAGSTFKGEFILDDYALYDLGPFPGIKERPGEAVWGELYDVQDSIIPILDSYEGEGELDKRVIVSVRNDTSTIDNVYVYVYIGNVSGNVVRSKWKSQR